MVPITMAIITVELFLLKLIKTVPPLFVQRLKLPAIYHAVLQLVRQNWKIYWVCFRNEGK